MPAPTPPTSHQNNLRLLDYTVTANVDPLPITREINKEEKEHDRVGAGVFGTAD